VNPFAQAKPKKYKKKSRNTTPAYRFIDRTRVQVQGGAGGHGSLSFTHVGKSFKKKPDGGHGGSGGSVIIVADKKEQTLRWSKNHQAAEDGSRGASQVMVGRTGKNLILKVPCGTIVKRVLNEYEEWDEQNWVVRRLPGSESAPTGGKFVFDDQGGVEYVHEYDDEFEDIEIFPDGRNSKRENDAAVLGGINTNDSRLDGETDAEESDDSDDDIGDDDIGDSDGLMVYSNGHQFIGDINTGKYISEGESDSDEDTDSDADDDWEDFPVLGIDRDGHRILGEITPKNHDAEEFEETDSETDETDSDTDDEWEDVKVLRVDAAGHRICGDINPEPYDSEDYDTGSDDELLGIPERKLVTLADLDTPGSYVVVARGGRGGVGNSAFASRHGPTSPTLMVKKSKPREGEVAFLELELKMIADIGLVGFPNAGKSSLLAAMSKAMPEIAPYPFTTLHPLIGSIEYRDGFKVLAADVPGLIAGASLGRGKGHDFLRHLERTKALLYMVDSAGTDGRNPYDDLRVLVEELTAYGDGDMLTRPALVVANKLDLLSEEESDEFTLELGCIAEELGIRFDGHVFGISAGVTGQGLGPLSRAIRHVVYQGETEREDYFQQANNSMQNS